MTNFQMKDLDIFLFLLKNIDCGYTSELPHLGGSNEYPQSMLLSKSKKLMYTPVNPKFTTFVYKSGVEWGVNYPLVLA